MFSLHSDNLLSFFSRVANQYQALTISDETEQTEAETPDNLQLDTSHKAAEVKASVKKYVTRSKKVICSNKIDEDIQKALQLSTVYVYSEAKAILEKALLKPETNFMAQVMLFAMLKLDCQDNPKSKQMRAEKMKQARAKFSEADFNAFLKNHMTDPSYISSYIIALCYNYGLGVEQSYTKSSEYLEQSLSEECYFGYHKLSYNYCSGRGVTRNVAKGIELAELAAKFGSVSAKNLLASLYYWGDNGSYIDFEKAFQYATEASQAGSVESTYLLGIIYQEGQAKQKDILKSIYHFSIAAERGHIKSMFHLAGIYLVDGIYSSVVKGIRFYVNAANLGCQRSIFKLSSMLYNTKQLNYFLKFLSYEQVLIDELPNLDFSSSLMPTAVYTQLKLNAQQRYIAFLQYQLFSSDSLFLNTFSGHALILGIIQGYVNSVTADDSILWSLIEEPEFRECGEGSWYRVRG